MTPLRLPALLVAVSLWSAPIVADGAPLFEDDALLEMTITGPLSDIIDDRDERRRQPFILAVEGNEHQVQIRMRGKSRARVCGFPPLRFYFDPADVAGTVFTDQTDLKLVTHCRGSESAEQNVLEEFLAYRIFNLISDVSFRVRLLRIRYVDTSDGDAIERYAFFLETDDALAERTGGTRTKIEGVRLSELAAQQATRMYVFQYLIGNTDWSMVTADEETYCCHNGELLHIDGKLHYVPYDFDLAGLVNANYAKPDPSLRISSVRQRRYRGYCIDRESLAAGLEHIVSLEAEIFTTVSELPGLSERARKSMVRYVERFFKEASDRDKLLASFERRCL